MLYTDCNHMIIHMPVSKNRIPLMNNIKKIFKGQQMIVDAVDSTIINKDFFRNIKNFKRMPTLNEKSLFARVGCFLSHLRCYEYIIKNRLNNVIIFEDDAVLTDKNFLKKQIDTDKDIVFLGHKIYTGNKNPQITQAHAIYYKDWKVVKQIYDYALDNQNRWRAFDIFLNNEILPHMNYGLYQFFDQISEELGSTINIGLSKKCYDSFHNNSH